MIIDLNILKRLGKRFGVFPISKVPDLQQALSNPQVFIKAPAGFEPLITGGGYQWDDELNGYRCGNQKLFILPNGIHIWTFKDILARGLNPDSVQKWVSSDEEYPMGKANAFFIIYGKLTGQDLGEGETAGDDIPDGETDPDSGGGVAMADDENAPPFSKQDVQNMLKGEFPPDVGPKTSMATSIPKTPKTPAAPMDRSKVGNPPVEVGSEAEKIIKTLYKKAKINPALKLSKQNPIRLDPDAIIDLYQRAKTMPPEEGEKLIAFLKSGAVMPLEEGKILKSDLEMLLQGVVRGIVNEVKEAKKKAKDKKKDSKKPSPKKAGGSLHDTPPRMGKGGMPAHMAAHAGFLDKDEPKDHSQMDWEPSADAAPSHGAMGPDQEGAYKEWLEDLANQMWKDPQEIGHGQYLWRVEKARQAQTGEMVYLLRKRKTIEQSRFFMRKDNKWFYLDPAQGNHKWTPLEAIPPGEEPSIEQEQSGAGAAGDPGGMSVTANVSPVTGPNAFKKKKREEGVEEELDEMTTTSGGGGSSTGTTGYNVPGAFSPEGGSKAGVKGSEKLGYTLTAIGKEDMKQKADKLYEEMKSNLKLMTKLSVKESAMGSLGPKFAAAQRAYDAQTPPEDPEPMECNKCGGDAHITKSGRKGSYWWWEAVCSKCGNKMGDDNF